MTTYTIKTTMTEADAIAKGEKSFIFRGESQPFGYGDEISFQVYAGQQMKRHNLEGRKFRVTYVSTDAPVERGFKVIGFREVR